MAEAFAAATPTWVPASAIARMQASSPDMARTMTTGMPQANGEMAVEAVMDAQRVADAVVYMASLPLDANVLFMTVMATKMPYVGRG